MKLSGANSAWAKQVNRTHILSLLFNQGPLSRQRIIEHTGLSNGAVSLITKDLLAQGVITELGEDPSVGRSVGRRAILLDLVADYAYTLGFEISANSINFVCIDLKGEIKEKLQIRRKQNASLQLTVNQISKLIEKFITDSGIAKEKILGVGVGTPGIVDNVTGTIRHSRNIGWEYTPLGETLTKILDLPVIVDNNVHAMGFGECLFKKKNDDLVLFTFIGRGIGGAILSKGEIIRGNDNAAGEIGHTLIDNNGAKCSCGHNGCLEVFVANPAIVAKAKPFFSSGEELTIDNVVESAKAGDQQSQQVLVGAAEHLGLGLSNAINTLNPSLIVVTGKIIDAGDFMSEAIIEHARKRCFSLTGQEIPIECKPFDQYLSAFGAAAIALEQFFYQPSLS